MKSKVMNFPLAHSVTSRKFFQLILLILLMAVALSSCYAQPARVSQYPAVHSFIQSMTQQYNFDPKQLNQLFDNVQMRQEVVKSMNKPAEAISWERYRRIFITDKRIQGGVQFWQKHAQTLALAEQQYGVPASIITAIIGVETLYGVNTGNYRVVDSLSTLAFVYPTRQNYFRNELKEYLLLTRELQLDPLALKGSYAGAIGLPQFMPSSYRNFAVNSRNTVNIDLLNDPDDAILSVANYFKKHGWQPGQAVAARARMTKASGVNLVQTSSKPHLLLSEYLQQGVSPVENYDARQKAALIQLAGETGAEYWLVFNNFYSITRYNNSINYAMAVFQLSQAIAQQMQHKLVPANKQAIATAKKVGHPQKHKKTAKPKSLKPVMSADKGVQL